jgi:hypothetical protein
MTTKTDDRIRASYEECGCSCHGNMAEKVMHVMPCCKTCPTCNKHIAEVFWADHVDAHKRWRPVVDAQ